MNFDTLYKIVTESNNVEEDIFVILSKEQLRLKKLIKKFFEEQHTNYSEKTYNDVENFIRGEFDKYKQFCDSHQEKIKENPKLRDLFDLFARKYAIYFQ